MGGTSRRLAVRALLVLGGLFAGFGLLAGHCNRQLIDGPTFAANVDEVRRDPAVAAAVGERVTTVLLRANPDLVAIRPLVASVATGVAAGDGLSGPVQLAARQAHAALTDPNADSVLLRVADVGSLVAGTLAVVAPERAPNAAEVSVTLAEFGGQSFTSATIAVAHWLDVLAWLLPILSLACLAGAVLASPDRWLGASRAGLSLAVAAVAVGLLLALGGFAIHQVDTSTLGGAMANAAWQVFVRPLWWGVLVLGGVGLLLAATAGAAVPEWLADFPGRLRRGFVARPSSAAAVVVRGVAAIVTGVAFVVDAAGTIELAAVVGGVMLAAWGMAKVSNVAAVTRRARESRSNGPQTSPSRWLGVVALALLVLAAGTTWLAWPGRKVAAVPPHSEATGCNGHVELCGRRFDDVAYVASHNAMSVAGSPGWFLGEQADPIPIQLDQGVRALLVDVWAGRPAGTVVRTAPGSYAEAEQVVVEELGPEVAGAARRLADSVAGVAEGPEALYLCHGLCEIGATELSDVLVELRAWLTVNPRDVVTLFVEDHVSAERIAADIEAAALLPFVYTPRPDQSFATLEAMVDSGQRLVVMLEEGNGGDAAPWLVNGFELTQDTPYTFPTVESFSCAENRGPPDAPLLLLNHWLSSFRSLVTSAQLVNAFDVLLPRAQQCEAERGQVPNFVAVNYVAIGDVRTVVDTLNGVGSSASSSTTTAP